MALGNRPLNEQKLSRSWEASELLRLVGTWFKLVEIVAAFMRYAPNPWGSSWHTWPWAPQPHTPTNPALVISSGPATMCQLLFVHFVLVCQALRDEFRPSTSAYSVRYARHGGAWVAASRYSWFKHRGTCEGSISILQLDCMETEFRW
jgi:hypothetical protein